MTEISELEGSSTRHDNAVTLDPSIDSDGSIVFTELQSMSCHAVDQVHEDGIDSKSMIGESQGLTREVLKCQQGYYGETTDCANHESTVERKIGEEPDGIYKEDAHVTDLTNELMSLVDIGIKRKVTEEQTATSPKEGNNYPEQVITTADQTSNAFPCKNNIHQVSDEVHIEDQDEASEASATCSTKMFPEEESQSLLDVWQVKNQSMHHQTKLNQTPSNDFSCENTLDKIDGDCDDDDDDDDKKLLRTWSREENEDNGNVLKLIRKASVAVTGGALVAVGLPMIPMPTPGGVVVVGSGMALLATEFPAAQKALDRSRQGLANLVGDDEDDDDEKKEKKKKIAKVADLVFQDEETAKKEAAKRRTKKLLNPLTAMQGPKAPSLFNNKEVQEFKDRTVNAANGAKKSVKRFIRHTVLPLMERITSDHSSSSRTDRKPNPRSTSTLRMKLGNTDMPGTLSVCRSKE